MSTISTQSKQLGQSLLDARIITADQLQIALKEQQAHPAPLGKILVTLGFVSEAVMRDALGAALAQDSMDLSNVIPDQAALALLDKALAIRYQVLPISYQSDELLLATTEHENLAQLDAIKAHIGQSIKLKTVLVGATELQQALDRFYGYELAIDKILQELESHQHAANIIETTDEYRHPLIRLVDAILIDAVKQRASDIHFEPEQHFLRIRYRIDGVLQQIRSLHKDYWPAVVVRLKVMANINIAETRAPQDGRFTLNISGHAVDFRLAIQPVLHGENIVLRILDRQQSLTTIAEIGFTEHELQTLQMLLNRPQGVILLTGPTGSGKTTTLYAILNQLNSSSVNIMTLEDPVEYPLPQIRQTSINSAVKLDFVSGIRAILRQDPDIILVGEIRDQQTAQMTFRAAMTGHQVYSTLHSNSAISALPRLYDMGLQAEILNNNIIGIIAQRLVRRLCPHCKLEQTTDIHTMALLGINKAVTVYIPQGCEQCHFQGYKGRQAIVEILRIDNELDELIAQRASVAQLLACAKRKGFQSLAENGIKAILEGVTSVAEVSRVIDLTINLGTSDLL